MTAPLATPATVRLSARFATELPELALAWRAEAAPEPRLLALDDDLARELGLDPATLRSAEGLRLLTGEQPPEGAVPVAQAYAGHQFGGYSPRLGDGRALLLGELVDASGALRDLHLKGSGRTPFSRGGDGLAAVGPMLREFVVSTAMHALGVPTTRALAVVATGRAVQREQALPGAVLARVAASHLRVGTFQYAAATGDRALLRRLTEHAIARHHPAAAGAEDPALGLLEAVIGVQARLVARWMLLGFVHGVMNTDNVLISGETIDYGPCAFLDAFDPAASFSSIDTGGRYAWGNQAPITEWNLARFAEALLPLVAGEGGDEADEDDAVQRATAVLHTFRDRYAEAWTAGLAAKLGLPADQAEAGALGQQLLELMQADRVDLTGAFRALGPAARGDAGPLRGLFLDLAGIDAWLARWRTLDPDAALIERTNPVYIPRNHLLEEALDAATAGDLGPVERLVEVLRDPFTERAGLERYAAPAPASFTHTTYCGT